ncbi:hypothetical protein, partial [Neptunitalea chrysea]|uniref:hypothetical protein n=1 Tax=Neptunitalea chrysea TaxID=1647581 RepID=UPI0024901D73
FENGNALTIDQPIDPRLNGLTPQALNGANYSNWATPYKAEVDAPIAGTIKVGKALSFTAPEINGTEWDEIAAGSEDITIPDGYKSSAIKVEWHTPNENNGPYGGVNVAIAGKQFSSSESSTSAIVKGLYGSVPVSYDSLGYHVGNINVVIV